MSLLGDFITRIELLISQMRKTNNYNSDWSALPTVGLVNDKNFQSFPCGQAVAINESSFDEGNFANAYSNESLIEIIVRDASVTVESDPVVDIRALFYNDLEDLKKLFGVDTTLNTLGVETFWYESMELVLNESRDYFTPKHMIVRFRMRYFQDRESPSTVAC